MVREAVSPFPLPRARVTAEGLTERLKWLAGQSHFELSLKPRDSQADLMGSLFDAAERANLEGVRPLAARLRPRNLDEFLGQEHFLGPGHLLRRMLEADRLGSLIFYGPPGIGKTTLAHIIAQQTQSRFVAINAAASSVKELRDILATARNELAAAGRTTILFIDELHRFNRAQQDVLLGDVEEGIVTLIGATTQNPFFSLNAPLLSRSQIFQFKPLGSDQIKTLLRRALKDPRGGLADLDIALSDEAADFLAQACDGDARRALGALEIAVRSTTTLPVTIDLVAAQDSIQRKALVYDGTGDEHYDVASAFIKSMRGSDPDAAIYWLARMLESGEDPRFIARRIAICAAEDVGNADPQALVLANAALQISEFVGMPECQLPLAQAVIYVACAPKSNAATMAICRAREDVQAGRTLPVPEHLKDSHYPGARRLGHGEGYQYSHDSENGWVDQAYLAEPRDYYQPVDRGYEAEIRRRLEYIRKHRKKA